MIKSIFLFLLYATPVVSQTLYQRNKEIMDSVRKVADSATVLRTAINSVSGGLSPTGNGSQLTGLTKTQVGLSNVDNTSDANKPISGPTQIALDAKQASGSYVLQSTTVNGHALSGNVAVTASDVGLGSVNNTSDAGKPVSTAQQTALDLKANLISPTFTGTVTLPASTSLTTPVLGSATGTSVALSGAITSSGTAGIGYVGSGVGGAITQSSTRSTGVTINKICGTITGNSTSLAASTSATFVVTNNTVALRDVVLVSLVSGATANTSIFTVSAVAAGSFSIRISNISTTTADTGVPILNFIIIKAANN